MCNATVTVDDEHGLLLKHQDIYVGQHLFKKNENSVTYTLKISYWFITLYYFLL